MPVIAGLEVVFPFREESEFDIAQGDCGSRRIVAAPLSERTKHHVGLPDRLGSETSPTLVREV